MRLSVERHVVFQVPVEIPTEILELILSHVDSEHIKLVRQVCRLFNDAASKFLIRTVFFSSSKRDLEVLKLVSEHSVFSRHVENLVYDCRMFEKVMVSDKASYIDNFKTLGFSTGSQLSFTSALATTSYRKYKQYYTDQQSLRRDGIDTACLATALSSMPRLVDVTVSGNIRPQFRNDGWCDRRVDSPEIVLPRPRLQSSTGDWRIDEAQSAGEIQDFLHAISSPRVACQLRSFSASHVSRASMSHNLFKTTSEYSSPCQEAFRHLRRLDLKISYHLRNHHSALHLNSQLRLSESLGGLKFLKSLSLEFHRNIPSFINLSTLYQGPSFINLSQMFEGCVLPCLEELELGYMTCTLLGTVDFIAAHSSTLRHLRFNGTEFQPGHGSWGQFMEQLKPLDLRLRFFEVSHLAEYSEEEEDGSYATFVTHHLIGFLEGRAPDPFGEIIIRDE